MAKVRAESIPPDKPTNAPSKPFFLTGNTSTLYVLPVFDLKTDGPTVIEVPKGMLGAFNDAWFRYMQDIGPFGPDKGNGGKYLIMKISKLSITKSEII